MQHFNPNPVQASIISSPIAGRIFLEGVAGTGKTTAAVGRLNRLIQEGVNANDILVLVPQRTLAYQYEKALQDPSLPAGGEANILTIGGLAQRTTSLFWPLIAQNAGFSNPSLPPVFLTLETAQYYLSQLVDPLIENQGYFEAIHLDKNRVLSQVIDNLNKAAAVGLPYTEIGQRLKTQTVVGFGQRARYRLTRSLFSLAGQKDLDRLSKTPAQQVGIAFKGDKAARLQPGLERNMEAVDCI